MLEKTLYGWFMVTLCYLVTYYGTACLYQIIFSEPIDHDWDASGLFIGSFLVTVPYVLAGLYARKMYPQPLKGAFWVSVVPALAEKGLLYLIGIYWVGIERVSGIAGRTPMMLVRGEAAPFFTTGYILCSVISIMLALYIAGRKGKRGA